MRKNKTEYICFSQKNCDDFAVNEDWRYQMYFFPFINRNFLKSSIILLVLI